MLDPHYDLYTTFKSIDHKLNNIGSRLTALDTKIDGLEEKIINSILHCLNKQSTPYSSDHDQSTDFFCDDNARSMHDINPKQNKKLLIDGISATKTDFNESGYQTDEMTQAVSDDFELISFDDDDHTTQDTNKLNGTVEKETNDFLSMLLHIKSSDEERSSCSNGRRLSNISSASMVSQISQKSESAKKAKKGLYASQVLELIGNFIQVSDRSGYITHYNAVIKFLINSLKTDDTFKQIFKGEIMAGSYRDGLKISIPNEYDTILRLNFGDKSNLTVERVVDEPNHCTIQVKECEYKAKPYLKQFIDGEGYLLLDTIGIWIQNLFRRILKPLDDNGKIIQIGDHSYQYSHSVKGPAFKFKISVIDSEIKFDMDLVPAIPFDFSHWIATRPYSRDTNQVNWIVVAKPPKNGMRRPYRSFTCSYTEMEKHILHDANQAKNLIRIFKKLRDTQELTELKSYYIKTIFLWKFDNTTIFKRKEFWSRPLDVIFVEMFKTILNHIRTRKLFFYWEPSYNKFTTIPGTVLKSWEEKLGGIESRLDTIMADNPKALLDIILTKDEKEKLEQKNPKLTMNEATSIQSSL